MQVLNRIVPLLAPLMALAACDEPGPLSAAAKGHLPPAPAAPAWSAGLRDQPLSASFPETTACLGWVDLLADRYAGARKVIGWGWNTPRAEPVARLVAVDDQGRMVGFGEGGLARPDVPRAAPEVRSDDSGWEVVASAPPGSVVQIYGVDPARGSACRIGQIEIAR